MTVQELKELLDTIEPDRQIILAEDAEGNGYRPCSDVWLCRYKDGSCGLEKLIAGYSEEDVMDDGIPALVLWPADKV